MGYNANYSLAAKTAMEVLEDYEISQAPINLQIIFDALSSELRLCTYADFMKSTGMTLSETIAFLDSDFGTCLYNPQTEQYAIFYNTAHVDEFCRFTVAHELGHYFLGHHRKARVTTLSRSFISKADYEEYEKEANVFARNLLSPAPLALELRKASQPGSVMYNIEMAFSITSRAAKVRVDFINRDLRDYTEHMRQVASAIKMRCQPFCWHCKTRNPIDVSYCITCGNSRVSWFNSYLPLPPEVKFDKNGLFYSCPRCGNNDIAEDAEFCITCGLPLKNYCLADKQSGPKHIHYNTSNAKFCARCGSTTRYNTINFYPSMEVIPEMKYTDGVEYDSETMKIKKCPLCGNEEFSNNSFYCRICGTDLFNNCIGDEDTDMNGFPVIYNQHANPSNARFCEVCGKETMFFRKGILRSYQKYQEDEEEEAQIDAMMAAQYQGDPDADDIPFFPDFGNDGPPF